ncbi:MAG: diguanylate cyclase [Negativicutes bacterium]|nr:diguanylate cyclase [Negativicutes bacterium]
MESTTILQEQIQTVFDLYLRLYFTERNYEQVIRLFHPYFCCIGTAKDEVSLSQENSMALYARDIAQYQEPIPYELTFVKIINVAPSVGVVLAGLNVDLKIHGLDMRIDGLRMSLVFVKEEENWLLQHLHISKEQDNLEAGEAFPLKKMEEKNRLLQQMVDDRTKELSKALESIEIAAITDQLTGLYNRRKFDEILKRALKQATENGNSLSVILGDLDHFKKVNDTFGHLIGDRVLKETGQILRANIRPVDALARWGGEEFIILLPDTPLKEAAAIAERLRNTIQQTKFEPRFPISISFGIAEYITGDTYDTLLKRADDALYRAKNKGRNRVEIGT